MSKRKLVMFDNNLLDLSQVFYVTQPSYNKHVEKWSFSIGLNGERGTNSVSIFRKGESWEQQHDITDLHDEFTKMVLKNG